MWRTVVPVVASIALAVAAPAADTAKVGDIAIDQPRGASTGQRAEQRRLHDPAEHGRDCPTG